MRLDALIDGLPVKLVNGDPGVVITDVTDDSRQVAPGSLFIARSGAAGEDGARYIAQAVAAGAAAVITPPPPPPPPPPPEGGAVEGLAGVAVVQAERVDQALAGELAERFFGHPSRKLRLIGVTGTSGKTTTAYLVQHLLQAVGLKCGLIGTIVIDDGQNREPAELTTPGAVAFVRLLARMVDHGCEAAVAEVSSHALHQGRTAALKFAAGVLTNLTGDHLDYHLTMDDYAAAKALLFEGLDASAWAVVNANDLYAQRMVAASPAKRCWTTLGEAGPEAGVWTRAEVLEPLADGSRARFTGPWGSVEVRLPLVGRHNVANTLQAIAVANAVSNGLGKVLREALETAPQVPGRLERVAVAAGEAATPTVLVDYAHKADALENVLLALRPLVRPGGKLVCVFGCGGDRDRTKRPKMAAIACRLADRVWVTSDNPRTEDPRKIVEEILAGAPGAAIPGAGRVDGERPTVEIDRSRAIQRAIAEAGPRDTVLIAGKGHEDYQIIGTAKRHFDDREHAAAALAAWVEERATPCRTSR